MHKPKFKAKEHFGKCTTQNLYMHKTKSESKEQCFYFCSSSQSHRGACNIYRANTCTPLQVQNSPQQTGCLSKKNQTRDIKVTVSPSSHSKIRQNPKKRNSAFIAVFYLRVTVRPSSQSKVTRIPQQVQLDPQHPIFTTAKKRSDMVCQFITQNHCMNKTKFKAKEQCFYCCFSSQSHGQAFITEISSLHPTASPRRPIAHNICKKTIRDIVC